MPKRQGICLVRPSQAESGWWVVWRPVLECWQTVILFWPCEISPTQHSQFELTTKINNPDINIGLLWTRPSRVMAPLVLPICHNPFSLVLGSFVVCLPPSSLTLSCFCFSLSLYSSFKCSKRPTIGFDVHFYILHLSKETWRLNWFFVLAACLRLSENVPIKKQELNTQQSTHQGKN